MISQATHHPPTFYYEGLLCHSVPFHQSVRAASRTLRSFLFLLLIIYKHLLKSKYTYSVSVDILYLASGYIIKL